MSQQNSLTSLPFAFWLEDRQEQSAIYIVDPEKRAEQRINLYIENTLEQTLFFSPTNLEQHPPSRENCHFELRFRRGVLDNASLGTSTFKGLEGKTMELLLTGKYQKRAYDIGSWVISAPEDHDEGEPYVSFYLARAEKGSGGRFLPGERFRLVLTNISASLAEGSSETRVELVPRNIFYGPPLQADSQPVTEPREQNVLVVNHTGKEHIPLHLAFIGPYTLRNDGQAQGEGHLLRLRITNTSRHDALTFNEDSRLLFAFDFAEGDQEEELGVAGNVEKIQFYLKERYTESANSDWQNLGNDAARIQAYLETYCAALTPPSPGGQNPIWKLGEEQDLSTLTLEPHQHWDIILDTSDFSTASPAGLTPLHITYEGIPGYWDGKLHTAVEKTPLIVRKGTGIPGHTPPPHQETVEMDSGNRTLYLMGNNRDGSANDHARLHVMGRTFVDGKLVATGETQLRGEVKVSKSLTVDEQVGIGTPIPKSKVDIHGDLRLEADGLAAGLSCENNKLLNLEVNYRIQPDAEDTGGAAFRIDYRDRFPLFNWMKREKPSPSQDARDTQLMVLSRSGNLGLGIERDTEPAQKLEVAGNIKARGRVQDKTGDVMPVGAIIAFGGKRIPDGWLECNGQSIANDQKYSELREVLGEVVLASFKETGDTKFIRKGYVVPDLRSRFIIGQGKGSGKDGGDHDLGEFRMHKIGGEIEHKLSIAELPEHDHKYRKFKLKAIDYKGGGDNSQGNGTGGNEDGHTDGWTGNNKPHNNLPPYYALRYIIKC